MIDSSHEAEASVVLEAEERRGRLPDCRSALVDLLPDGDERARLALALAERVLKAEPDRYVREAAYALLAELPGPRDQALEMLYLVRQDRLPGL